MTRSHKYFLYIASGIFTLLVFLWYNHNVLNAEPPLLKADHSPKRIKPESNGETIISANDNIYDTLKNQSNKGLDANKQVHLMPEPEAPISLPSQQKQVSQEDVIDSIISGIVDGEEGGQKQIEDPKEIKSLNIVTMVDADDAEASAKPKISKKIYYIQIASTRTQKQANAEWLRVNKSHNKMFSGMNHKVMKYEFGDNGIFYQLLIGPFPSSSSTKLFCKKLVSARLNCVIKRM